MKQIKQLNNRNEKTRKPENKRYCCTATGKQNVPCINSKRSIPPTTTRPFNCKSACNAAMTDWHFFSANLEVTGENKRGAKTNKDKDTESTCKKVSALRNRQGHHHQNQPLFFVPNLDSMFAWATVIRTSRPWYRTTENPWRSVWSFKSNTRRQQVKKCRAYS